jgi:hypothetical protein
MDAKALHNRLLTDHFLQPARPPGGHLLALVFTTGPFYNRFLSSLAIGRNRCCRWALRTIEFGLGLDPPQ